MKRGRAGGRTRLELREPGPLARRPRAWSARRGAGGARAGRPDSRSGSCAAPLAAGRRPPGVQVESLAAEVSDCGLKLLQLLPVLDCH